MNISDIFLRAGRNLRESKARTILTALAIAVGATTITIAMAAGNGGRAYTNEMVQTSGDAYSLSVFAKPDMSEQEAATGLPEYGVAAEDETSQGGRLLTEGDIKEIRKLEGVQSISPMLEVSAEYATRGEGEKKFVAPLSVKVDRTKIDLAAGSLTNNIPKANQVIVPEGYLETFGFASAETAIGKKLFINVPEYAAMGQPTGNSQNFEFTIAAVDRKSDTNLYYSEALRVSAADSEKMYAYQRGNETKNQYYGLVVLASEGTNIAELQTQIADKGYDVYSLEDQREQLLQVIDIAQWGLIGFGALAVIASIFGIINTQYISVLERTQQIGLMKAVGASRRDVARLFRYEAAWVGLLGGLIGVLIAYAVTLLNPIIASSLSLEAGTRLLRMDWVASLGLIVGLMLISILSGYFPSRKAAKLDPIEALRTE
jgi:putative ABC transport system permease protein